LRGKRRAASLKRRPSWLTRLPDDGRKVFVQVIGDRWPEDLRYTGQVIAGPWFGVLDVPSFAQGWASRAEVGEFIYVSGHTRLERVR